MARPFVLLSVAVSIDGYIDDSHAERLLLSNAADFDRVDQMRAESDAILIGAETMRKDNPRLLVNSEDRRNARMSRGLSAYPLKVTVTQSGNLDPTLKFWHHGGDKLVYTTAQAEAKVREQLGSLAQVVSLGESIDFGALLDDLGDRGVNQLMVEGGGRIHTAFLSQALADEIHMAIAPIVVGDSDAPRFLHPANYPGGSTRRMELIEATPIGDVVLVRYRPKVTSA